MSKNHSTYQEYVARINRVIDYIAQNLDRQLQIPELANVACFSEYHFHRIFGLIVGESLNNYVRRMRLERAAVFLTLDRLKTITDIAYRFGFSSSANFTKAFKAHFGISPSAFRKDGKKYLIENSRNGKTNSKIGKVSNEKERDYFNRWEQPINLEDLDITLKNLPALHVAYVRTLQGYNEDSIGKSWEILLKWAEPRGLIHNGTIALGIEHDDPHLSGIEKCRYDACITVPGSMKDFQGEIGIQDLAQGIYAVHRFIAEGNIFDAMTDGYFAIFRWIAENDLVPSNACSYTVYLTPENMENDEPAELAICVMVEPIDF